MADLVERFRELLTADPRLSSQREIAVRLNTCERTLRRHLRAASTSYELELKRARLQAAKTLLATTDEPIKCIAVDSGFTASARLCQVFREFECTTPQMWREATRRVHLEK